MEESSAMPLRVTTRHSEDFDIFSATIDPSKSPYSNLNGISNYCEKVKSLYAQLRVQSAIWTTPESDPPESFEPAKPLEYLLEINEDRVLAWIDEFTWTEYLRGERACFSISKTPKQYRMTSILVSSPIKRDEVKEVRKYAEGNNGRCILIWKGLW
jgi:hypothetical protein